MPIIKDGDNKIQYTPMAEGPRANETGTFIDRDFALCDEKDQLKQIAFDVAAQTTNTTITFKSAAGNVGNITLTLPNVDTVLGAGATSSDSFTTIQCDAGTNPVASSTTDTLTLTAADDSAVITGNSTTDTVDFAVRYSNPFNTTSEAFGNGATTNSTKSTAIGRNATTYDGQRNTAIGHDSKAGVTGLSAVTDCLALGQEAKAQGTSAGLSVAVGRNTNAQFDRCTTVGASSSCASSGGFTGGAQSNANNGVGSIVLGGNADDDASAQFVAGSATYPITEAVFGEGPSSASPQDFSLRTTNASGTNIAAKDFYLKPGRSTGSAAPSSLIFQTTSAGASGTTLQTLTTVIELTDGNVIMGNLPTSDPIVTGALWNDSGTLKVS